MKKKAVVKSEVPKQEETFGNIYLKFEENPLEVFNLYYKKECNHDRINELEKNLSVIQSIEDKIKYLKKILKEYYLFIDPTTLSVSGMTIAKGIFPPDTKLFFDRTIQIYIDGYEAERLAKKKKKSIVTAPAVSLFAQIVNFSGIIPYDEEKYNRTTYCQCVIDYFKINNVTAEKCRQAFKIHEPDLKQSDRNFQIVFRSLF